MAKNVWRKVVQLIRYDHLGCILKLYDCSKVDELDVLDFLIELIEFDHYVFWLNIAVDQAHVGNLIEEVAYLLDEFGQVF